MDNRFRCLVDLHSLLRLMIEGRSDEIHVPISDYHPKAHSSPLSAESSPLIAVLRDRQSSAPTYAPHILLDPVNDERPCMTRQLSITVYQATSVLAYSQHLPTIVPGLSWTQYSVSSPLSSRSYSFAALYQALTSSGLHP